MSLVLNGRLTGQTEATVAAFNASIDIDQTLLPQDISGSLAHAKGLEKIGVLSQEESQQIQSGLRVVEAKIQKGDYPLNHELEDIHMAVEFYLKQEIGALAGKLHTGRSRNDQVATDMHLYIKDNNQALQSKLKALIATLNDLAKTHIEVIMPGYTHLQQAQPIRFSHHMLAYAWMFLRDLDRLKDAQKRIDLCPLGAGALAGSGYPVDRQFLANELGFSALYENSLDAVSDRDYLIETINTLSLIMLHFSRLCEELIIWSSQEFNFIEISDTFCTSSSMMPQKKNPDIPELIRGKSATLLGTQVQLASLIKNLPLTYNKDMQEDKLWVFQSLDTVHTCVSLMTPLLQTLTLNTDIMRNTCEKGFTNATDLADYLVGKGMPFREAYRKVGALVKHCLANNQTLLGLSLEEMKSQIPEVDEQVFDALNTETIVEKRTVRGGTSKASVLEQINLVSEKLA